MSAPLSESSAKATEPGSVTVTMPQLGETVAEGTVSRWLKKVGDNVSTEEPLLEISTDKVDTEIVAPASGVLAEITVTGGETVPVGTVLAQIAAAGAAAPGAAPVEAGTAEPQQSGTGGQPGSAHRVNGSGGGNRNVHSPLVRRLAAEHGVDLQTVSGSGVGGRITRSDVLLAAREAASAQPPARQEPAPRVPTPVERDRSETMSPLRRVIAERMLSSLRTSAQLTTVVEADMTAVAALRDRLKADVESHEGVKLTFLPFFAKAALAALRALPSVNASLDEDGRRVTYHDREHIGVAVDTERGLLVPVIRDAGQLSVAGLAQRIADLAERARTNRLSPDELTGGTFTITNTGSRGALFDTPIINQPQVAILGTGSVQRRPVVARDDRGNEVVTIRSMVYLALTYDHRLIDGADAARFLSVVKSKLETGALGE